MTKKWKIRSFCLVAIAMVGLILGLLVLPCWLFRPCSLTIHSTMVELPELNGPIFANALEGVLGQFNEKHFRMGNQVYVCRGLAGDAEIRSKYTAQAVDRAAQSNPGYDPQIPEQKRIQGLLLDVLLTNHTSTDRK